MKSFVFALLVALVGGGILIAQRFEVEIRDYLGLPEIAEESSAGAETKEKSESDKNSDAKDSAATDKLMQNTGDSKEAAILQLVTLRYPDYPEKSFEEIVPDLASLPLDAYPEQITVTKPLNLKLTTNGTVAGASFIKAGGAIRPLKLSTEGRLTLSSLAHNELTASVPLSDTNFERSIRERFALAAKEANERLQVMRDADASYFRENNRDFEVLNNEGSLWGDPNDDDFLLVQAALDQKLNQSGFKATGFSRAQKQTVEVDGQNLTCKTIVVLLEGKDNGFGPYRWRSIAYLRGSNVVKWDDFPDDAVKEARRTAQR